MINVLHLRDTDRICGPGKTIIETCAKIDCSQYRLMIGLFVRKIDEENVYKKAAEARGIIVLPIVVKNKFDFSAIGQIISLINQHDIHILHSHEYKSDIIAFLVSMRYRIPIVSTAHGWIINTIKSKFYIGLGKNVLRYFNKVIAVSPKIKSELFKFNVKAEKCSLIYNAIVTENYNPGIYEKDILRKRYNLPKNSFLFGNIGRLSPEKGQKDFVLASKTISKEYPNTYFFLVGDGPDKTDLQTYINDLELCQRVFLTGHYNDIRPVFQDLNALGLTSYTEGFPNVLLESISMNTPIFATNVGGVDDIVIPGKTGLLIPDHDINAIEESMRYILENPEECQNHVHNGKNLINDRYNFNDRVKKIQALYSEVISTWKSQ